MPHIIEIGPEIQIDDSCQSLDNRLIDSVYRFMRVWRAIFLLCRELLRWRAGDVGTPF